MKVSLSKSIVLFLCFLILCCGDEKKSYRKHFYNVEWLSPDNSLALIKEEYDVTVKGSGCTVVASDVLPQEQTSPVIPPSEIYITDLNGKAKKKLIGDKQLVSKMEKSPMTPQFFFLIKNHPNEFGLIDTSGNVTFFDSLQEVSMSWSPDASKIIVSGTKKGESHSNLYGISLSTNGIVKFVDEQLNTFGVAWSNQNQIAYAYGIFNYTTLAVINSDGSGKKMIDTCKGATRFIRWSNDGNRILYTCWDDTLDFTRIVEYNNTTLEKKILFSTRSQYIYSLRYSTDNNFISIGTENGLYVIASNGGQISFVSNKSHDCSWSPNDNEIVYSEYYFSADTLRYLRFTPPYTYE